MACAETLDEFDEPYGGWSACGEQEGAELRRLRSARPATCAPVRPPEPVCLPRALRRGGSEANRRAFLRTVSHELRTPLNAVIGFAEIISRELHGPIGDPRYAEHARLIRESGLDLLRLVNQVVDIARLEAGAMDLDLRPEPLDEMVSEAFAAAAEPAQARGVRLVQLLAWDAGRVRADRRGVGMVLGALLADAVAASPEGEAVTVLARRRGDRVFLTVRDKGAGFTAQELPNLLRPFEQGETGLVRRTVGVGLGLPLARLLCAAMGGRLHLRSAPGEGVTAIVRLAAA